MMHVLIGIALKSLLIAGITLGLLALMKRRSAAERSWIAHTGLFVLLGVALAPVALPSWEVEAPALLGRAPAVAATILDSPPSTAAAPASFQGKPLPEVKRAVVTRRSAVPVLNIAAATTALYSIPAAILLFITFLALGRLIALRGRADVLVDSHWLSALARAQRRMGFKHGTALLTSDELSSPVSWGLLRPVILLNTRAVEASGEAEAIIAHELAHVARMDWLKLLLARLATALFWFNPLVWVLAREAHQLREEAADDSVLAADIVDTHYAELLVGVARHECPGLLLGAHGVAPSKGSLARRVARVLDGKQVRRPVARSFASGIAGGAVLVAAPLAALTLTPGHATTRAQPASATDVPPDVPHLIAHGVSTSVSTVAAAVSLGQSKAVEEAAQATTVASNAADQAREESRDRLDAARDALADARQAREDAAADAAEATREARTAVRVKVTRNGHIDQIIEMRAAGVEPAYVNALRAVQPRLRKLEASNFAGMKSVGVTPEYARDLASAGLRNLDADQLAAAKATGLSADYVRGLTAAGMPANLNEDIQLRAVGVPTHYVVSIRKAGYHVTDANTIIQMWAVGVRPGDLRGGPTPPRPPHPAVPPPILDPGDG